MDRYEYNLKSDQIKKLYGKKDYATVAVIANTIDWSRVKNNGMLAMVADAYEGTKQYEKARDILEIAYERSPMGRQLAYRLTIISLRMRDFVSADEYYQDFIELAPMDVAQYILKYRIARAKGEDLSALINILEAYADVEMDERWQYELAKLYHEAGETDKCVEMCDKIILWFSQGKYVTKAMELKMKHEPLTDEQQAKYDGKWDYYNEKIKSEEKSKEEEKQQEEEQKEEDEIQEETDKETDKPVENEVAEDEWQQRDILNDTTALDYLNDYTEDEKLIHEPKEPELDEETAMEVEKRLAQIVEQSMVSVRSEMNMEDSETGGNVEDDSLLKDEKEDIEDMDDTELVAKAYTSEDEIENLEEHEEYNNQEDSYSDNESDIEQKTEKVSSEESGIPSDSKIEIFEFDESKSGKMKNIGEELMKTAEIDIDEINLQVKPLDGSAYDTSNIQEALAKSMEIILQAENEKAARNAFLESGVMDEPTKRIDKEDVQEKPEHKKLVYETVPLQPIYDKEEDGQIKLSQPVEVEEQVAGQMDIEDVLLELEKRKREALEEAARREEEARELARHAAEQAAAARAAVERAMEEEAAARAALEKASKTQEALLSGGMLPDDIQSVLNEVGIIQVSEENEEASQDIQEESQPDNFTDSLMDSNDESENQPDDEPQDVNEEYTEPDLDNDEITEDGLSQEENTDDETGLSDEYKKMFVDFLDIMGLEEQIAAALDNLINKFVQDGTSRTNNVMIMGDAKSGKTTLALTLIKAANKGRGRNGRKVAKVKATALNKNGISAAMSQILGTDLIIEQAGNLMPGTAVDLIAAMKAYTEEMIIVLEDDKAALERLVTANPVLEDIFNNQISIKEFEMDELVKMAKDYAESKQYIVDEMGTLALYAKINDISGKNQGISRTEIYEIIDEAIVHAERFKISKLIGKIKRTHYEMGVLKEEDF
ncbi:MAG: hypothetical protein K2I03_07075 [Lachnospiraceae bacterium]|nr:hypothetical protein [Lachnospiraceae bacterium]MDE6232232.1 hypothetical protein [Lachnospiraceae bacterium]MDE6251298.1 hypothetical protein [Lachnospiraceae bacterium]